MILDQDGTDPNFPIGGLSIKPSYQCHDQDQEGCQEWRRDNEEDIRQWGIAGRIWEATYLLTKYLSIKTQYIEYDPPCSLFESMHNGRIVELGAGVGVVGIHLALQLAKVDTVGSRDKVVLTDLDNVLPLLNRNIKRAGLLSSNTIQVSSAALPWGSESHAKLLQEETFPDGISHIICSDLIYFPELLAPLFRTLIELTNVLSPPEIIIGYKLRSYAKEELFWKAFGVWFDFRPVLCKDQGEKEQRRFGSKAKDVAQGELDELEGEMAAEDEVFIFVANRKSSTFGSMMPKSEEKLLGGWLSQDGHLIRGEGAETFELILMNAIQDS